MSQRKSDGFCGGPGSCSQVRDELQQQAIRAMAAHKGSTGFTVYQFEDLHLQQNETLMRTIMERDVALFAEISGDANPIHLCDTYAASTRFGQRIAHGMFTASLISALMGTKLPGPGAVYLSQSLTFLAPVKIGDVVVARVEVAELVSERRRVRLACECMVDGKLVLEGEAWVAMPPLLRKQSSQVA